MMFSSLAGGRLNHALSMATKTLQIEHGVFSISLESIQGIFESRLYNTLQ